MFYPSLPFLACIAVPLYGLWLARRGLRISRLFLTLAALMGGAALLAYAFEALISAPGLQAWPFSSVLTLTSEGGSHSTSTVRLPPAFALLNAALLAASAALYWLQELRRATFYSRFTRWLAAPMASLAAATEPMTFALAYFAGFYDWSTARTPDKLFIIAASVGFTLTAVALAGFIIQLVVSMLRALKGQRSA
ncbi:hypothetical protein [Lentibacter sp. XHP0401]|jgi:hypothetical protein|uniref:hypothetical protein n=1 Tax=Lentibacter sp. XHP0401 TaxID=2984334 RepID=UPI0021E8F9BA|nr:hypothetical protein [Lentibacter sp. XHP0401]MCV2891475.1 hypothetical protein [Lentibacter sp. XHP0401]